MIPRPVALLLPRSVGSLSLRPLLPRSGLGLWLLLRLWPGLSSGYRLFSSFPAMASPACSSSAKASPKVSPFGSMGRSEDVAIRHADPKLTLNSKALNP